MKRIFDMLGGLTATLLLAGCVESSTVVHVNRDGSGRVMVREFFSPQITQMIEGMGAMGAEGETPKDFIEEMITSKAEQMGPGTERVSSERIENARGWKGFEAEYRFADVRQLRMRIGDGPSPGGMARDDGDAIRFDFEPGDPARLTVRQPPTPEAEADDGEAAEAGEEMNEAMLQMMKPMLEGMRISFSVSVDGRIRETNSQFVASDRGSLVVMDMAMDRVLANPEAVKLLGRQSPDTPARLAALDIEGVRIEPPGKAIELSF